MLFVQRTRVRSVSSRGWITASGLCAFATLLFLFGPFSTSFGYGPDESQSRWQSLEPGLDLGEFAAPNASAVGDSHVTVVRIDPGRFKLDLLSVIGLALPDSLGIDAWSSRYHLSAAITPACSSVTAAQPRATRGSARRRSIQTGSRAITRFSRSIQTT